MVIHGKEKGKEGEEEGNDKEEISRELGKG
jgi:hypothetical protein